VVQVIRPARAPTRVALLLSLAFATGACLPDSGTSDRGAGDFASIGPTATARVVRVVDGDTVQVEIAGERQTVRYIGIDAPEVARGGVPAEPLSREATAANADLVAGRTVVLERDVSDVDRFDRLLRYVWVSNDGGWQFVNEELVRLGLADARRYQPDTARQDELDAAESAARSAARGLWATP